MQEVSGSSPLSYTGQKRNSNRSNRQYSRKVQQRRPDGPPYVCSDRISSPTQAAGSACPAALRSLSPGQIRSLWSCDRCRVATVRHRRTARSPVTVAAFAGGRRAAVPGFWNVAAGGRVGCSGVHTRRPGIRGLVRCAGWRWCGRCAVRLGRDAPWRDPAQLPGALAHPHGAVARRGALAWPCHVQRGIGPGRLAHLGQLAPARLRRAARATSSRGCRDRQRPAPAASRSGWIQA
jgi:hypothetical protein